MLAQAAEKGRIRLLRRLMLLHVAIGVLLTGLRAWEFASLNVLWYDNAYGSIIWALLLLHAVHFLTDWFDSLVLTGLMHGRHALEGRRYVDVSENCLYWRFVWLTWLPIYVLIYWLPRWTA